MPPFPLNATESVALNLGLFLAAAAAVLTVLWLLLQIVSWFRPKEVYATKAELAALEARLGSFDGKLDRLSSSMQLGFTDIQRALGRLEGREHV
jgi:hypothetical protein